MEHIIKYKDSVGELIEEKFLGAFVEYSKEYYSQDQKLFKTELIENQQVMLVTYENSGENHKELFCIHQEDYGNITADFLEAHQVTEDGYKVRGYLYEKGKLTFVRDTYYDNADEIMKEISLNPSKNYAATMIEYYEYDENRELIRITQKTMDDKIISINTLIK